MRGIKTLLAAAAITAMGMPAVAAEETLSKEAIEGIVHDYILENPEVLVEALAVLQERERVAQEARKRAAIQANIEALSEAPNDPVAGNPDGDVVIVEFFDYRCPYCKRVVDSLMDTVEDDGNIRLVFKEFPILGPESLLAARAALASQNQDKYLEFHLALMKVEGRLTEDNIYEIADSVGLDVDELKEDMNGREVQQHINESYRLAEALGITGTPGFVIGRQVVPGAISMQEIQNFVAAARNES